MTLVDALGAQAARVEDAASYCLGSLLWSAFFFMLGYLTALAVTAVSDHLGEKHRDNT